MELSGSGVNENGVDQRREAFESMIKGYPVPDNSTTRRTEASPTFRGWAPVEITDTDTSSTRKGKRITFTFTSAICLRPWTTFSRLLGGHLEWKYRQRKMEENPLWTRPPNSNTLPRIFFSYLSEPLSFSNLSCSLYRERGRRRRRKKERKRRRRRRREGGGGGGASSSCSFASEKADIYIYIDI